jgi:hypothetical protein
VYPKITLNSKFLGFCPDPSKRKITKIKNAIEKSQNLIEELRTRSNLSPIANI